MSAVACRYCGLPFQVRRVEPGRDYYCCTGCAVLGRLPVDPQGNFPVNTHLVSALAVGFVYFNQLLSWAVAVLLAREGKAELGERFWWISIGAAFVTWAGVILVQWRERSMRGKDVVFSGLVLLLLVVSCGVTPGRAGVAAAANAVLLVWSFRGLLRKRLTDGSSAV